MIRRRWLIVALAGIAVLLITGRGLASLYADYLWFESVGGGAVWRTRTLYTALLVSTSAIVSGLVIFLNLYAVRRSIVSLVLPRRVANIEIGEEVPGPYLTGIVVGLSTLFAVLLKISGRTWQAFALAVHGVPFMESDPYYRADLGFFVYRVPFETALHLWAMITLLAATALVVFLYALTPSLRLERGALHVSAYVRRHLSVIAFLLLLMMAWAYRLDGFELVIDGSTVENGFTFRDHYFGLRATPILAFLTLGAAFVVLWTGWSGQLPIVLGAVSVVLVLSFILRQVIPALELGAGDANAAERERPYIAIREGYSQRAFAVDDIVRADASVGFQTWSEAARGVPVWDTPALARALSPRASSSLSPGLRMTAAGLIATVAISSADSGASPAGSDRWVIARARASRVDSRGGAVRVDDHGVPVSDDPTIPAVVHPGARGPWLGVDSLGVSAAPTLESFGSRLAHAWSLQNFRLLFGERLDPGTIIITHRDVRDRLRTLAPFFDQGSTIGTAVVADTLFWIVELYSSSATYPLSAPIPVAGAVRKYFQHAATAVVNAGTGHVQLVRAARMDPIARTWVERFPGLFGSMDELPRELVDALPAARDGAMAQAHAFARFGTRQDSASGGRLAADFSADTVLPVINLTEVVLPISAPAAAWVQPVLDSTDRLMGVILASGGPNRVTLWYPTPALHARWTQILDKIHQSADTTSAPRDTRWARGPIRAFPVAGTLAFAQTTYAWRTSSRASPTVARVAVLAGDSVVASGPSLAHAVGVATELDSATPLTPQDFRTRVEVIYASLVAAFRRGDWVAFGEAMEALRAALGAPRPLVPPPAPR